jgi:hypothetical protein
MTDANQDKPNLRNGIPEDDLADGMMLVGQVGDEAVLLVRKGTEVFAIGGPPAPITAGRSATACWSRTRCAALGIMPASACAPARRSPLRR